MHLRSKTMVSFSSHHSQQDFSLNCIGEQKLSIRSSIPAIYSNSLETFVLTLKLSQQLESLYFPVGAIWLLRAQHDNRSSRPRTQSMQTLLRQPSMLSLLRHSYSSLEFPGCRWIDSWRILPSRVCKQAHPYFQNKFFWIHGPGGRCLCCKGSISGPGIQLLL